MKAFYAMQQTEFVCFFVIFVFIFYLLNDENDDDDERKIEMYREREKENLIC